MKRLILTHIAQADLASIRRYSIRTWGPQQTADYMDGLRETMKKLARGTAHVRTRDDLRPGLLLTNSGRHRIFFEADEIRILVVRVLHDSMDYPRHLGAEGEDDA